MTPESHPAEATILLFLDGELNPEEAQDLARHLESCWQCRARASDLESSISGFVRFKQEHLDSVPPAEDGPGALLRAQIAVRSAGARLRISYWLSLGIPAAAAALAAALLLLPGTTVSAGHLPDGRLTPGATKLISTTQVCALDDSMEDRRPSPALAQQVFRRYHIANPQPNTFEVDYLVDPLLGGAEDVRNLWPQPFAEGKWNSRVKDALEDHLRAKVCAGEMELVRAQAEIAENWVEAYRRHFKTSEPLAAHALFVKDKPWE